MEGRTFEFSFSIPISKRQHPPRTVKATAKRRKAKATPPGEYERQRRQDPERQEYHRNYQKERRQQRIAEGLCTRCPNKAIPGETYCETCKDIHRAKRSTAKEADRNRKRERREERAAAGLCYRCPEPAAPGKAYCNPCHTIKLGRQAKEREARSQSPERMEKKRLQEQKYRQERKAKGICENCSNKAIPDQNRCEACRDKHRAAWQRYKAKRQAESENAAATAPQGVPV